MAVPDQELLSHHAVAVSPGHGRKLVHGGYDAIWRRRRSGGTRVSSATNAAAAVALRDLIISFALADGTTYTAVERASLSVADGEFVSIVGPTGCGKSTLLNIAAGLLAPTAGSVSILGAPLMGLNRSAGYLFQADALFPLKNRIEHVSSAL